MVFKRPDIKQEYLTLAILVVHNIYSEWYVLIEEDPNISFEKEGQVYGKLGKTVEMLDQSRVRSVFNPDSPSWETVKIESKILEYNKGKNVT